MYDKKAMKKLDSKRTKIIYEVNNVKIYQYNKKGSSNIKLIVLENERFSRFISANELVEIVERATKGQYASMSDLKLGYKVPRVNKHC